MSLGEVVVIVRLALVVVCAFVMCWSCEMSLHVIFAVGTGRFLCATSAQYCWGCALLGTEGYSCKTLLALRGHLG